MIEPTIGWEVPGLQIQDASGTARMVIDADLVPEHNDRRTPVVPPGPYAFERVDDLFGHDLAGGLSGDGEGGPVPTLGTPQEHSAPEEPSAEAYERTRYSLNDFL